MWTGYQTGLGLKEETVGLGSEGRNSRNYLIQEGRMNQRKRKSLRRRNFRWNIKGNKKLGKR